MASCALEGCNDPTCPVCRWTRVPQLPPRCRRWVSGHRCRLIEKHTGECKPPYGKARTTKKTDLRDGTAKPKAKPKLW